MYTLLIVFHVLACFALILIVLLQTGRGAEMGAAFGGASQTLFGGAGGSTFLGKLTTAAAVVFMLTCLGLSYLVAGPVTKSIMESVPVEKPQGPVLPDAKPLQAAPEQTTATEAPAKPQGSIEVQEQAQPAPQAQESAKQEQLPAASPKPEKKPPAPAPKK